LKMSDTGLNASIYEQLRGYADRFDCALVKLHSRDRSAASKACEDLAALLKELSSTSESAGSRLVGTVLRKELANRLGDLDKTFAALVTTLDQSALSGEQIAQLEDIASVIDRECLNAGARMRGRA